MSNFVSYANAIEIMEGIDAKLKAINGAYVFKGSVAFAGLPTPASANNGYVYNLNEDFTTDSRFIEGAGKDYPAGTNVAIADMSTSAYTVVTPEGTENPSEEGWYEENQGVYTLSEDTEVNSEKTYYELTITPSFKFDVIGSFFDVDELEAAIQAVSDMIAGMFDATEPYNAGDFVVYEGKLYQFDVNHAVGAWDSSEVTEKTVTDLIQAAEPDALTAAQVEALLAILD